MLFQGALLSTFVPRLVSLVGNALRCLSFYPTIKKAPRRFYGRGLFLFLLFLSSYALSHSRTSAYRATILRRMATTASMPSTLMHS